jgi:hypothetical protein
MSILARVEQSSRLCKVEVILLLKQEYRLFSSV